MQELCFPGTYPPVPLSQSTAVISAFLIVFISTGNSLVIIAIVKNPKKQLRTPFAYFLANLALSDLMVGVIAMPLSVRYHILEARRETNLGHIYIVHLTFFLSLTASLFSMAAMCFDRYFTIISLSNAQRRFTPRRCTKVSVGIWLLSIAFTGLYFLAGYITLVTVYLNVSFICIFGITLLTYIKILRSLKAISKVINTSSNGSSSFDDIDSKTNKDQRSKITKFKGTRINCKSRARDAVTASNQDEGRGQKGNKAAKHGQKSRCKQNKKIATEQRITRVFLAMLATFLSSNLPAIVFVYGLQFCRSCSCDVRHIFRDIVFLLLPTASGLNALICILKLPNIRRAVREILLFNRKNMYTFSSTDVGYFSKDRSPRFTARNSNVSLRKVTRRNTWTSKRNQTTYGLSNDAVQSPKLESNGEILGRQRCDEIIANDDPANFERDGADKRTRSNSCPGFYRARTAKGETYFIRGTRQAKTFRNTAHDNCNMAGRNYLDA